MAAQHCPCCGRRFNIWTSPATPDHHDERGSIRSDSVRIKRALEEEERHPTRPLVTGTNDAAPYSKRRRYTSSGGDITSPWLGGLPGLGKRHG